MIIETGQAQYTCLHLSAQKKNGQEAENKLYEPEKTKAKQISISREFGHVSKTDTFLAWKWHSKTGSSELLFDKWVYLIHIHRCNEKISTF